MYDHDHFNPEHCGPRPDQPMGCAGAEQNCNGAPQPCVVPPPIPPVRYVPGMNVQEQMCNMANQVNVCINRWNQIQAKCYETLDQVVGAAVNNDVYYTPDEVRYMEGYDEDSACAYALVEARAVDKSGKPIFCHLRAAYNNETNSGARENIADVSFVTSGQMVMTAVQATETHWNGTTVFNCNPGAGNPDDTVWVAGWNRNGVLRFFRGDVGQDVLRQNRMVNCIGPVFPVIKAGQLFEEVTGSIGENPGSIQAMGWKINGNKVFFSCSNYDQPGMTPQTVAKILQRMGCMTAVITSYQVNAVTAWDTMPAAGTENVVPAGGSATDVISAPGMTGGMTFLGKLTTAPIQWSVPQNCANWVISKRPPRGWQNAFTTEIANVVQRLGSQENSMNSILSQLQGENDNISKLENQIQQNTNDIEDINGQLSTFDSNIKTLNSQMTTVQEKVASLQQKVTSLDSELKQEVQNRIAGDATLKTDIDNEALARQAADNALQSAINSETAERKAADSLITAQLNQETSERKSADTVLQNAIDEEAGKRQEEDAKLTAAIDSEATTRAQADRNLQAAIEAEQSARSTKDTQHEARMDAIEAQEQKDVAAIDAQISDINGDIDAIKDGTGLPVATTEKLGAIIVGDNLTIDENGKLSAVGGGGEGGGDKVEAGAGILITTSGDTKTISVDDNVVVNEDELKAVADRVTAVETKQADQAAKDEQQDQSISAVQDSVGTLTTGLENANKEIVKNAEAIETATTVIQQIQNGEGLPIASAEKLGAFKVGANLSISEDGTLSASAGEGATGETVAQGAGIEVTHNTETNVATVALDAASQTAIAAIAGKAEQADLDALKTTVAGKADKQTVTELSEGMTEGFQNTAEHLNSLESKIATITETDNSQNAAISSLNSASTALTQRVGTAEQNIDALTTQQSKNTEDIATLTEGLANADTNVTHALDMAAAAEEEASKKVNKAGDTMTGPLTVSNETEPTKYSLLAPDGLVLNDDSVSTVVQLKKTMNGRNTRFELVDSSILPLNGTAQIIRNIATPQQQSDAAPKNYVDYGDNQAMGVANQANTTAAQANVNATAAQTAAEEAKQLAQEAKELAEQAASKEITWPLIFEGQNDVAIKLNSEDASSPSIELNSNQGGVSISSIGDTLALGSQNLKLPVIVEGVAKPIEDSQAANKAYVDAKVAEAGVGDYLPLTGGTLTGTVRAPEFTANPENAGSATLKGDSIIIGYGTQGVVRKNLIITANSGGTRLRASESATDIQGSLRVNVYGIENPTSASGAANKEYVDSAVENAGDGKFLPLSGGRVNGTLTVGSNSSNATTNIYNGQINLKTDSPTSSDVLGIIRVNNELALQARNTSYSSSNPVVMRGVATPSEKYDAANKQYVDSIPFVEALTVIVNTDDTFNVSFEHNHDYVLIIGSETTLCNAVVIANNTAYIVDYTMLAINSATDTKFYQGKLSVRVAGNRSVIINRNAPYYYGKFTVIGI